jgi:hypothetical protein
MGSLCIRLLASAGFQTRPVTSSSRRATGVRCSGVEVTAESLYETPIVVVALLRQEGWADVIAPGMQLEIQVRQPAATHRVTVVQLRRWCEGIAVSPEETWKKRKLRELLGSRLYACNR